MREVDRLLANVPLLRVDLGRCRDVGNVFDLLKGLSVPQQGAVLGVGVATGNGILRSFQNSKGNTVDVTAGLDVPEYARDVGTTCPGQRGTCPTGQRGKRHRSRPVWPR